jgi:GrpB-like predicted nucleotidyltransferase (UPF0157 family)
MGLELAKYSVGVGDRFGLQAAAQLRAFALALEHGVEIVPVWNKSNREHVIVGSEPASLRTAAEAAIRQLAWNRPWHVDADHIRLETVDRFIPCSDFFTIDVADMIGRQPPPASVRTFVTRHPELTATIEIPGLEGELKMTRSEIERSANKFLLAVAQAARIYRHIAKHKGVGSFITEVSMDETDAPQTPAELLVIVAALADEQVPVQTIAPKFTGRFNKGVDYVGDLDKFEKEFGDDLSVLAFAKQRYGLPDNLKLSVHSGSDKFSIYDPIRRLLRQHSAGLHLKTAGTTWLEELLGLAECGGAGLALAKTIYAEALDHIDDLCAPYASVVEIDRARLPTAATVAQWNSAQFAAALRHDQQCPAFNPSLRQLLHVGYKIAARQGERYLELVRACERTIACNVTNNLFERHLKALFVDHGRSPLRARNVNTEVDEPIVLAEYDPDWPGLFVAERGRIEAALGEIATRIEHFGSTAVPGMAGKPIVDVMVGVRDLGSAADRISALEALGYENFGEIFIPGRVYLRRRGPPHFNIAMTVEGGPFWNTQIMIRDYLRKHPPEVAAYCESKRSAYAQGCRMFSTYSQAKGPHLTALLERARQWYDSQLGKNQG